MASKKKTTELDVVEEIVKKPKKKPRGGNNILTDAALNVAPGDNTKYVILGARLFNLPPIDLKDPEQVSNRLNEFFQIHAEADMKPTVSGMGMALGLDRRRLWEIKTGNYNKNGMYADLPTLTMDSIKRAYEYMEILWENYMQNGKINPVSGIFLGKNNFGYQDKTEHIVTPNVNNDSDYDADDIRKRYITDSSTIDSDSDS
jgi:hypothetical protein